MLKAVSLQVLAALVLAFSLGPIAEARSYDSSKFPMKPDATMTPGKLCDRPTRMRYPENIKYCDRDVDPQTKWFVIKEYVRKFGFLVQQQI